MGEFFQFFTDPVLMAPTIGCMLMCLVGAVIGAFSVLKKQALVGEMLSHACYPGVVFALIFVEDIFAGVAMAGAFLSCIVGMVLVSFLQKKCKVASDSALCFVLASFFGIGLTALTAVQQSMPLVYKKLQSYLFGQAATMTNEHIWLYVALSAATLITLMLFYRLITVTIFDPEFAQVLGMNTAFAEMLVLLLTVVAVCIGIRSVGVVLMSSMLIFPCVAARFWSHRLGVILFLSALFGLASGFFGVYFSHTGSFYYSVSFPTGPLIVIVAALIFLVSCLFAPDRGLFVRMYRSFVFWNQCQQENILKSMYKAVSKSHKVHFSRDELVQRHRGQTLLLFMLKRKGRVRIIDKNMYELTPLGLLWGRKIVRLHRLWEVYLVTYCGLAQDRVHPSAEEMEHIITPEIESELEKILNHPHVDPHHQPIPLGSL